MTNLQQLYSYVLHEGAQTLCIAQNDVRAIQLAKAALMAGIRLLMERLGVERRSTAFDWPVLSVRTSTSCTRPCSA